MKANDEDSQILADSGGEANENIVMKMFRIVTQREH